VKNVLITGGAGFIGAYLTKKLIGMGVKVTVVDNLQDVGAISYVHPQARFINADITDVSLYSSLAKNKFDTVYHLAAQSAGEPSYDDPKYDVMTNSYATYLVAKFCKETGVSRLIYSSTVAVYGNSIGGVMDESYPINPDSIYGVSKFSGELFIRQILKDSNTKFTIFRVFNTYGPGENLNFQKKGVVSIYIGYIWKNKPVIVKGSLDRFRDLTYIEDTVNALICCHSIAKSFGEVYDLSSGSKIVVRELLKKLMSAFEKSSDYKVIEASCTPGDSFGFHSKAEKIRDHLQWSPTVGLDEGLSRYATWVNKVPIQDDLHAYHPFMMCKD